MGRVTGKSAQDFEQLLDGAITALRRRGRVSYAALKLRLSVSEDVLLALRDELVDVLELAYDREGRMLVLRDVVPASVPGNRPSEPTAKPDDAENRLLTLMFCDLVGSTELSSRVDAEDLREIVRGYQSLALQAVSRVDGYVAQYLGDGLLIYFGYPHAHEDDALRAARSGLDIIDSVQRLNGPHGERYGVTLAVRIGVHTGEVVVGDMGSGSNTETLALGMAPNIAARLEGLAAPNTMVVSAQTHKLLRDNVELSDLGTFQLKGIAEPQRVYRVVRILDPKPMARSDGNALVDRSDELAWLHSAWSDACSGSGSSVLICGEPGIGKSRLLREFVERERLEQRETMFFRGREDWRFSPLRPITDGLRSSWELNGLAPADAFARVSQRAADHGPEAAALTAEALDVAVPENQRLPPLTPQVQRYRTLNTLVELLTTPAQGCSRTLLFEDLHWFDPTSLELVGLAIGRAPTQGVLAVMTARSDFDHSWDETGLKKLALRRMTTEETASLVTIIAQTADLPAELVGRIGERAEGVPLFIEELTKTVLESDVVNRDAQGKVALSQPLEEQHIPSSIYGCLMARLDRLDVVRHVAQLAAVIGRRFSYALLCEAVDLDEAALAVSLSKLIEADLVRAEGEPPHAVYEFKHSMLQHAALQSLLRAKRRDLHGQVADALIRRFREQCAGEPELPAHHLSAAGRGSEALPYWRQAGLAAMGRFANLEAIAYFSRALEATEAIEDLGRRTGEQLSLEVLRAIPMMLTRGWGSADVQQSYERARTLCDAMGEAAPPELFPTRVGLGSYFIVTADWREATRIVEQNFALAERAGIDELLVETHTEMGVIRLYVGQPMQAIVHVDKAIELFDAGAHAHHLLMYGRNPAAVAYTTKALASWTVGRIDAAVEEARMALASLDELPHPFSYAWALSPNAAIHIFRGETKLAREYAECMCRFSEEQGFPYWHGQGILFRGWVSALEGAPQEGLGEIERGLEIWHASGTRMLEPMMTWPRAWALGLLGQHDEALRIVESSLAFIEESGELWWAPEVFRLRGELLEARDGPGSEVAMTSYQRALKLSEKHGAHIMRLRAATNLARLLGRRGQRSDGIALLAPIAGSIREGRQTRDVVTALTVLDELR